jgi:hypothetical protein
MFELCGLGRIKGCSAPGLLFPLFSIRTSNYTFVHELNRSYIIQCFRRCDAGYFDVIPHLHDGNFVEGSAGLIGFENPPVGIFLGTHSELMRWWPINSNAVPENGLLRAILTEIVSDDSMNKYRVWREYINEHFSGIESTSETTEVKLAQIQNWNKLWTDLEDDRHSAEQQDLEFIKNLFEQPKREVIEWLAWNCSSYLWRRVWERADRYILQTAESRELIYAYIEYCLMEIPSELHGNMSYLLRRVISDEMLRAVGDDRIEILREFVELGIVLLKRAGVLPSEFRDYCIRLYRHYPGPLAFGARIDA